MNKRMNCLQIALKEWVENDKKGVILYDNDHAQFFRRTPLDLISYGEKYFLSAFKESLTEDDKKALNDYLTD